MMTSTRVWITLVALILSTPAMADWTASDLDTLTQAFETGISSNYNYNVIPYGWVFSGCDPGATDCYGTNPDSPYGAPNFSTSTTQVQKVRQLRATSALVLIMETPPPMRYFGVTPYIFSRYYPTSIPNNSSTPGWINVFESLTDTVNLDVIGTTGSSSPGISPFTQLSVFIITADTITYSDIANEFLSLGFPGSAVNQLSLPINAVPLNMGVGSYSDYYSVLLRMAYPDDPTQLSDYLARAPISVLYLTPGTPRTVSALQTPTYRIPGDGQSEPSALATARDDLVNQLLTQFGNDYTITETHYLPKQTTNYVCVTYGLQCNGDNSDAIYTQDVSSYTPSSPQDRILIIGVNHDDTDKATYFSHSVVRASNQQGVVAASDSWLNGSALTMANITDPGDPRYSTYQQLYAFTISYSCGTDPTCLTIPQPTSTNPNGITYGDPLNVTGRIYLDPGTKTRPAVSELIFHRVFIMTKK